MSKEWAIYCNLSLWAVQCWPYLWSRWYPPQFFGDTLLTWPSIASLVISSGRGCCCFSLLLVVVLSKLSICFMLLTNWVYGIPVWRVLLNHVHEWNINCILQPCIKKMAAFCSFFGAVRTTRHLENDFFVLWRIINNKFWISSIILVWHCVEQSPGRGPCFICGIGSIQIHRHIYTSPACVFPDLLRGHMDTNSWNFVPIAFLPSNKH